MQTVYREWLKTSSVSGVLKTSCVSVSIHMSKPTVVFDPYASTDLRNIVQTIVDNYNVAITGQQNGIRSLSS